MPIYATAGSKLYIGGILEPNFEGDLTTASFTGITWTEVRPLESIGSFGDVAEVVTFSALSSVRVHKLKGVRDAGNMEVVIGLDHANPGQAALLAALASQSNFAFRVVFNDAPDADGTPSERRFVAVVIGATEVLDSASSVMKLQVTLGINSNIVRIAAAT